jgi:hypothetical protein
VAWRTTSGRSFACPGFWHVRGFSPAAAGGLGFRAPVNDGLGGREDHLIAVPYHAVSDDLGINSSAGLDPEARDVDPVQLHRCGQRSIAARQIAVRQSWDGAARGGQHDAEVTELPMLNMPLIQWFSGNALVPEGEKITTLGR